MRKKTELSLWVVDGGFGIDLIATGFLLAVIVTLILVPIQRRQLTDTPPATGTLSGLPGRLMPLLRAADSLPKFALLTGATGTLCAGATLLVMIAIDVTTLSPLHYSLFKSLWTGAFAAALAYLIIVVTGHRVGGITSPTTSNT